MSVSTHTLRVRLGERAYDLVIEAGVVDRAGTFLRPLLATPRVIVVSDTHLAKTPHVARLERALEAADIATQTILVEPGEGTKSFDHFEQLCERLLELGIDRRTTLVAFGGGVVGDLVGFAAAVLLRGLDYVQIPTTLLAQVDSSVGGKTGINSRHGKNLVGAFHQPRLVLIDTSVLDDLPDRQLLAGYAELVKHSLIRDAALFDWLDQNIERVLGREPQVLAEAISRSVAVKVAIVAADERETTGERALLNFGHTFAHAYETLDGYSDRLLHGEAVAIGMADAFRLSVALGTCPAQEAASAVRHLRHAGLPTTAAERDLRFAPDAVLLAMRKDKKAQSGHLTFVVSRGIGSAALASDVEDATVERVLAGDPVDARGA